MKGLLAAAAVLALCVAATDSAPQDMPTSGGPAVEVALDPAGPQPGNPDLTVEELDADGLPPRIDYPVEMDWICDGPRAVNVMPDTPEAWVAAERGCLRMDIALDRAPWPGDIRP